MTTSIDRAAEIINSFCCGYCEHFGQEQAHALADAGLLTPDLPAPDPPGGPVTDKTDALIARQWALRAVESAENTQPVSRGALAAARHILAATAPPTMADLDWDNDMHAGLCAESADDGVVMMIGLDWANDHADHIMCYLGNGQFDSLPLRALTPIPGTKINLTPRRASFSNEGAETGNENRNEGVETGNDHPVTENTPDHPTELTTAADYRNAPAGTVVAADGEGSWTKGNDGLWETYGTIDVFNNYALAGEDCRVLRWGWEA